MGLRIARCFPDSPYAFSDNVLRATIVGVQDVGRTAKDDWYLVLHDDGQTEELQVGSANQDSVLKSAMSHIITAQIQIEDIYSEWRIVSAKLTEVRSRNYFFSQNYKSSIRRAGGVSGKRRKPTVYQWLYG